MGVKMKDHIPSIIMDRIETPELLFSDSEFEYWIITISSAPMGD